MKRIFNKIILVLFVVVSLLLGWGSIFKSLSGVPFSGYSQSQGYYMSLAHISRTPN